jgi:hypothetical protein
MLFKLETFTTFLFRSISGFKEKKILYPIWTTPLLTRADYIIYYVKCKVIIWWITMFFHLMVYNLFFCTVWYHDRCICLHHIYAMYGGLFCGYIMWYHDIMCYDILASHLFTSCAMWYHSLFSGCIVCYDVVLIVCLTVLCWDGLWLCLLYFVPVFHHFVIYSPSNIFFFLVIKRNALQLIGVKL